MGCFCLGARLLSPGAENVKRVPQLKKALDEAHADNQGPLISTRPAAAVSEEAAAGIAVSGDQAGAGGELIAGSEKQLDQPEEPIGPAADAADLLPEAEGSAAPLLGEAEARAGVGTEAPPEAEQVAATGSGLQLDDSSSGQLAQEGGDGSRKEQAAEADAPAAVAEADANAAAEAVGGLSARGGSSSAGAFPEEPGGPVEEGSQVALLGPQADSEISLKQPRLSRLSSLLTCSSRMVGEDSGETRSRQHAGGGSMPPSARQPELQFEAAAAELVLLPRGKLVPLAQPEQALSDAAGMLGRQESPILLAALLTLRRVAIYRHDLLAGSLEDVLALLLECLHGTDTTVSQAAIMTILDLFISFGSRMLRHCENRLVPQHSCILGLLLAASTGRTPGIRQWADEALSWMALHMSPQARVLHMLEPYLEYAVPPVRHKAAEKLCVATYRPPDRPISPSGKWRS